VNAANWFGVRCLLHRCPFRPDSLGAYCTLGSCNRRITIHTSQTGYWQTLSSYNPGPGDLSHPMPQHTVDELVATLPIKPTNAQNTQE
jgi:hypothetical protein